MRRRNCLMLMDEERTGPGIYIFLAQRKYSQVSLLTLVSRAFSCSLLCCLPYLGGCSAVLVESDARLMLIGFSISNHRAGLFCQCC